MYVTLVNFHFGWFTKKGPHKSPKIEFSLHFMKEFGTCGGLFCGTSTNGKLACHALSLLLILMLFWVLLLLMFIHAIGTSDSSEVHS